MKPELIKWSEKNYSHLNWRVNRTPYGTLVSEIMLQQTTVGTVLNHFDRFLKKYPNIYELAKASEEEILMDWKGLGYYRRAKNLLKAAKEIVSKFKGEIPMSLNELTSINGIGLYTANAIRSIGHDHWAVALDANLERVLARYYEVSEVKGSKLQGKLYQLFDEGKILGEFKGLSPRKLNEALMDLGRSICKANSIDCEICPLRSTCKTRFKNPLSFPKENKLISKEKQIPLNLLRIILKKNGKYLAYKKSKNQWLSGQYEVPTFEMGNENLVPHQYPALEGFESLDLLPEIKTSITKYKITNKILYINSKELNTFPIDLKHYEWISPEKLSTASLKAIDF